MDKIAELFRINRRIQSEYEAAIPLMRDAEVIRSLRFLTDLDELAAKFQFTPRDILLFLAPELDSQQLQESTRSESVLAKDAAARPSRRGREYPVKRYKNPHTGDVLETRGANHTLLKQWKGTYGAAVVEGWRVY
jgi:hypothetical protein